MIIDFKQRVCKKLWSYLRKNSSAMLCTWKLIILFSEWQKCPRQQTLKQETEPSGRLWWDVGHRPFEDVLWAKATSLGKEDSSLSLGRRGAQAGATKAEVSSKERWWFRRISEPPFWGGPQSPPHQSFVQCCLLSPTETLSFETGRQHDVTYRTDM